MKYKSYRLGNCTVRTSENTLTFDLDDKKISVSIPPKFIELLSYLADEYPRVVPREELINQIWQSNAYVGEKALTNAVWHLRKYFNQYQQHEVIQTVRKVGYGLTLSPFYFISDFDLSDKLDTHPIIPPPKPDFLAKNQLKNQENKGDTHSNWHQKQATAQNEKLKKTSDTQAKSIENQSELGFFVTKKKTKLMSYFAFTLVLATLAQVADSWWLYQGKASNKPAHVSPITSEPGSELFAAPSPNGESLVYAKTTSQGTNLFLTRVNHPNQAPRQLTFDGSIQGISTWGKKGKFLYFARRGTQSTQCDIVQLDVKAQEEKVIAPCYNKGGYFYMDVSPDGKILAVQNRLAMDKNSGIYFIHLQDNYRMERFSCSQACKHKDRDMAFSPDGRYLAVTRRSGTFNEHLFLIDLSNRQEQQLTQHLEDIVGLAWSIDSKSILYASQRSDIRQGFIYDLSEQTNQALAISGFSYPAIAKQTGDVFFQQRQEHFHIAKLALDQSMTSSPFPLLESSFSYKDPDYSSMREQIAYTANKNGHYELWVADANGNNRKVLTNLELNVRHPKWSHDGNHIAFLAANKDQSGDSLYIYDVQKDRIKTVNTGYKNHKRPTWSPDDKALISAIRVEGKLNLYRVDIHSFALSQLTEKNGRHGYLTEEGELLFSTSKGGVWRKSLQNKSQPPQRLISPKLINSTYSWTPTSSGIYFQHSESNVASIRYFDFATNQITHILSLSSGHIRRSANIAHMDNHNTLLLPLKRLPQSDIKRLLHPQLSTHHIHP